MKSPVAAAIGASATAPSVMRKCQVLRRVARGVDDVDRHVADGDAVAVANERAFGGKRILPVRIALVRQQQRRAGPLRELAAARQKVGVNVGLGDVSDVEVCELAAASTYVSASRLGSMTIACACVRRTQSDSCSARAAARRSV